MKALQAQKLHTIQTEIDSFMAISAKGFYEAGLRLKRIRDERLYKTVANTFEEYIKHYGKYSRSTIYNLIAVAEKFGTVLGNVQKLDIDYSRLVQALPYTNEKNAEDWYHKAKELPPHGFRTEIYEARHKIDQDACQHEEITIIEIEKCKACNKITRYTTVGEE